MFVFYIAITLIVLGVIFIITSIEVKTSQKVEVTSPEKSHFKNITKGKFLKKIPVNSFKRKKRLKPKVNTDNKIDERIDEKKDKLNISEENVIEDDISENITENITEDITEDVNDDDNAEYIEPTVKVSISDITNSLASDEESIVLQKDDIKQEEDTKKEKDSEITALAALYEDRDDVINFDFINADTTTSRKKYKNLKRIGQGKVSLNKRSLVIRCDKKMYKYDLDKLSSLEAKENTVIFKLRGSEIPMFMLIESNFEFVGKLLKNYSYCLKD